MNKLGTLPIHPGLFDPEYFWARVERLGPDDCWPWTGSLNTQGYGRVRCGRRSYQAHRISCVIHDMPLTTNDVVDHLCRNTRCVNPAHLEATTPAMNTARGSGPTAALVHARMAGMCVNGHVLSVVGLHSQGDSMTCAECGRERVRRYRARKRMAALAGAGGAVMGIFSKPNTPKPPPRPKPPKPPKAPKPASPPGR